MIITEEWIHVRYNIAKEIYETEVTYVNSLTQVVEVTFLSN